MLKIIYTVLMYYQIFIGVYYTLVPMYFCIDYITSKVFSAQYIL